MSFFKSISQAIKTAKIESPLNQTAESLPKYIGQCVYEWEWTVRGYRGTLERGFGRSFVIELNKSKKSVKLIEKTESQISWRRKLQVKEFEMSESQDREIELAIGDCIRNAPPTPEQSAAVAMLALFLLLIAVLVRRSKS